MSDLFNYLKKAGAVTVQVEPPKKPEAAPVDLKPLEQKLDRQQAIVADALDRIEKAVKQKVTMEYVVKRDAEGLIKSVVAVPQLGNTLTT
jgi:hypothetical protein